MRASLTADFVKKAVSESFWDFGNSILYDLCARNPRHERDDVIAAKIWLIGRAYAAAIERKRDSADASDGDTFYTDVVVPKIRESKIDEWFCAISGDKANDTELTLRVHKRVMDLFTVISGLEKRSLASKYLHFHFPNRFYLYDSRAQRGIRARTASIGRKLPPLREFDETYARFFLRARTLNFELDALVGTHLLPRDLDKVLLALEL